MSKNQKLLLHCCCGPCSVSCVDSLRKEGIQPHLYWFNPNIHPTAEYILRRDSLADFAASENLGLTLIDEYGLRDFLEAFYSQNVSRCEICYRMRLEKTAQAASEGCYEAFSTTLLISPYQKHEEIIRIGEEMAAKYGVGFFYRDFRPLFKAGQKAARLRNLYMQKYCGCIFSEEERYNGQGMGDGGQEIVVGNLSGKQYDWLSNINSHSSSSSVPHSLFERLKLLIGNDNIKKLNNAKVIVFGLGGVGSWCAEALVRSGIGKLEIVDFDRVCESNVNRQLQATAKTVGQSKAETLRKRLSEINPGCQIITHENIFSKETADGFDIKSADYVIDAIDMLTNKLDLIETVYNAGVTLYSSMGMALKMDPLRIKTGSIWETDVCPLARLVRQGLRKRGFDGDFTVVYSDETPMEKKGSVNGSIVTVTASAGLLLANLVIENVTDKFSHGAHRGTGNTEK